MEWAFQRFPFVVLCGLAGLVTFSNAQQVSNNTIVPQELVRRAVANELNPRMGTKNIYSSTTRKILMARRP